MTFDSRLPTPDPSPRPLTSDPRPPTPDPRPLDPRPLLIYTSPRIETTTDSQRHVGCRRLVLPPGRFSISTVQHGTSMWMTVRLSNFRKLNYFSKFFDVSLSRSPILGSRSTTGLPRKNRL